MVYILFKKQKSLAGSVINCQGGLEVQVAAVKSELCCSYKSATQLQSVKDMDI